MNIREYVKQTGITAEVIEDRGIVHDDGWEHRAATVRLSNPQNGETMVTPWRQGMGIVEHPSEQVAEIVDSLISDAWSYQQARDFEDWADEYGYDTDSRTAEATYRAIGELAPGIVALLGGPDAFDYAATEIGRL